MAGAVANTPDPLRDYNGGVDTINSMRDMINKARRENGEKPVEVDHQAIKANEKKFSEITSDIAQMDFKKWLALTIAGFTSFHFGSSFSTRAMANITIRSFCN